MAVFSCRQIVLPDKGKLLSDYAEGDIIYLEERGEITPFYVAKHDYESGLNGPGRTLLVRKKTADYITIWGTFSTNKIMYDGSSVDTYLNGTYVNRFSSKVKSAIGKTNIPCVESNNSSTIVTLSRKIFALSATELGDTSSNHKVEGAALPDVVVDLLTSGILSTYWTRTPYKYDSSLDIQKAYWVNAVGQLLAGTIDDKYDHIPAFTFPSTARFHSKTDLFKEVW